MKKGNINIEIFETGKYREPGQQAELPLAAKQYLEN